MNFKETPEFQKVFKRLKKKYLSLDQDLAEFKKVVSVFPEGRGKHFALLTERAGIKIIRARLFCRYLKGDSLRIIYAYKQTADLIEFIEVYAKSEQEAKDRILIKNYLEK